MTISKTMLQHINLTFGLESDDSHVLFMRPAKWKAGLSRWLPEGCAVLPQPLPDRIPWQVGMEANSPLRGAFADGNTVLVFHPGIGKQDSAWPKGFPDSSKRGKAWMKRKTGYFDFTGEYFDCFECEGMSNGVFDENFEQLVFDEDECFLCGGGGSLEALSGPYAMFVLEPLSDLELLALAAKED